MGDRGDGKVAGQVEAGACLVGVERFRSHGHEEDLATGDPAGDPLIYQKRSSR